MFLKLQFCELFLASARRRLTSGGCRCVFCVWWTVLKETAMHHVWLRFSSPPVRFLLRPILGDIYTISRGPRWSPGPVPQPLPCAMPKGGTWPGGVALDPLSGMDSAGSCDSVISMNSGYVSVPVHLLAFVPPVHCITLLSSGLFEPTLTVQGSFAFETTVKRQFILTIQIHTGT